MKRRWKVLIAVVALALATAAFTGFAVASDDDDGTEVPITGVELEQATRAALAHLGEGTVTETEKGDEESLYEVEVTLDDGSQIDVQLDENFNVVSADPDDEHEDGDDD